MSSAVPQLHHLSFSSRFCGQCTCLNLGEVCFNYNIPASVIRDNVRVVCLEIRFFHLLSYGFMQKMEEEEVEWVYMRRDGRQMSNGWVRDGRKQHGA